MLLSYLKLYNNLQFDVSEKNIPIYQESIDAITDPSQRATLKEIRDMKINHERNAKTYKYYDNPRAMQECQQCIDALQQLDFKVDTPADTRILHTNDAAINVSVVTIIKDTNGNSKWVNSG